MYDVIFNRYDGQSITFAENVSFANLPNAITFLASLMEPGESITVECVK